MIDFHLGHVKNKNIETLETHKCCGGELHLIAFASESLSIPIKVLDIVGTPSPEQDKEQIRKWGAKVHVFLPPQAVAGKKVPVLYCLAGMTCDETNFPIKSNALRFAAEYNIALVCPDTSPRGKGIPELSEVKFLGPGASYYLNATAPPWSLHYQMGRFITEELPSLVESMFPLLPERRGILGHSMGGMGALCWSLKKSDMWQSVSAFAPLCHPTKADEKFFDGLITKTYFGSDESGIRGYDPCFLLEDGHLFPNEILIDQGTDDPLLDKLMPQELIAAAKKAGQKLNLRRQEGYDHSYWFVQSFIEDHLKHHSHFLNA